jgi:hypothetical protein
MSFSSDLKVGRLEAGGLGGFVSGAVSGVWVQRVQNIQNARDGFADPRTASVMRVTITPAKSAVELIQDF